MYDLSATPFFLKGSGYSEGTLFPWVVSDFGLIDAIEAGLVKIPRVPVEDDTLEEGGQPTYRNLWLNIRDHLPKKGGTAKRERRSSTATCTSSGCSSEPLHQLQEGLRTLAQQSADEDEAPPVFIVVCNNTNVSKLVYDWVSGWEKESGWGRAVVPGELPLFSNEMAGAGRPGPSRSWSTPSSSTAGKL